MIYALDTNVILDILSTQEDYQEESKKVLEEASEEGYFIISPEVYAELVTEFAGKFDNPQEELDRFLQEKNITLRDHNRASLAKAGREWEDYAATDPVECPSCGAEQDFTCENCSENVTWRNHMITDFLVGGHAEEHADRLITRDRGYFDTYFEIPVHYPSN
ncbi:MAG: type II toxin-antitoxin system VapC family toxin [Candidatus Nanohaloarchaea archaeon]